MEAISAAADSPKLRRWNRLLLGSEDFVGEMKIMEVYDKPFRSELKLRLHNLGEPLRQLFKKEVGRTVPG